MFRTVSPRSVLILLARCQQTRMTYTIAVCTVKNSPEDGQSNRPVRAPDGHLHSVKIPDAV